MTRILSIMLIAGSFGSLAVAADPPPMDDAHRIKAEKLLDRGVKYLLSKRDETGGWSLRGGSFRPAMTALALRSLVQHPDYTSASPEVQKGFEVLLGYQQEDGGIYNPKEGRSNYCNSIAICALAAAKDAKYKPSMDKALAFLRTIQIKEGSKSRDPQKEGEVIGKDHPYIGGFSYGPEHGRPDIVNAGWAMEAMNEAGVDGNDPDMQRAMAFITRCQNRSESNPLAFAREGSNDGGFVYAPAKRDISLGESKAGDGVGGRGLRSYGSVSYIAWKSLLYAGVSMDDPRIKSVYAWIRQHWTLEQNPNMPKEQAQQGVFYYYLVFARALKVSGLVEIPDLKDRSVKHNWRHELVDALEARIKKDGSWVNPADRWMEGDPMLVTAYETIALAEVLSK